MLTLEGSQKAPGMKFAIVVSKFNDFVTDRLQAGAIEALASAGVAGDDICVIKVPGAFEIPFGAREAALRGHFAAVVCLGCLIRGETPHFEYIASACVAGHHRRGRIDRRADELRRADDQFRSKKRSNGPSTAPPTKAGKRRWPPSRWRRCSVRCGSPGPRRA